MAQELPNSNFISYLSKYGMDNNLQFDEFVSKEARKLEISPFEFVFPKIQEYRDRISKVIAARHSTVILLSGRAGDGKTHFLRQLFTDKELLGFSIEDWEKNPNCFLLKNKELNINFILVKDFTSNDTPANSELLRLKINEIMQQNEKLLQDAACKLENGKSLSDLSDSEYQELKSELESQETVPSSNCNIVLIAGNNGKVLERFQSFFAEDAREKHNLKKFIDALGSYMLNHDDSALQRVLGLLCLDISSCLGSDEIKSIFRSVMEHELWSKCESCKHYTYCPILRNRQTLLETKCLERLIDLHELSVDNGQHFTVRNVMLLLVNALLGSNDSAPLSCRIVDEEASPDRLALNAADEDAVINAKLMRDDSKLASIPFDNIFGYNSSARRYLQQETNGSGSMRPNKPEGAKYASPIFRDLEEFAVGAFSTKQIDDLLLAASAGEESRAPNMVQSSVQQSQLEPLLAQYDCYELCNRLKKVYRALQQELLPDDADERKEKKAELLYQLQEHLSTLRRMLFFVLKSKEEQDSSSTGQDYLFDPYLLTSYQFASDYLIFKHALTALKKKERARSSSSTDEFCAAQVAFRGKSVERTIAQALIVGLNRAFTGLMLGNETEDLYITTTNKFNPDAQSILFDEENYRIAVDYPNKKSDSKVFFALNDKGLIELRFFFNTDDLITPAPKFRDSKLLLTPKIFEYLMSLECGKLGACLPFSSEIINELSAFKASIEAKLQYLSLDDEDSEPDIQICKLNEDGKLD